MSLKMTLIEQGMQPDVVDEATTDLTYLGYFERGDSTKALIQKIEKTDTVTTFEFVDGIHDYIFDWAQRATYNYSYRKA